MKKIITYCFLFGLSFSANADTCAFGKMTSYDNKKLIQVFASPTAASRPAFNKFWYAQDDSCNNFIQLLMEVERKGWCTPNWNSIASYVFAEDGPGYFRGGSELSECRKIAKVLVDAK